MSRHFLCFNCLLCLFLCWGITGQVKAQDTKTVSVDCTSGKGKGKGKGGGGNSINEELGKNLDKILTIEITGMCAENVHVTRDNVTLRGSDPATDGIRGVSTDPNAPPSFGAVVHVEEGDFLTIENLTITEGAGHGIFFLESQANNVINSRLVDNGARGLRVFFGGVLVTDTTMTGNAFGGFSVGREGFVSCDNCTIEDNPASGQSTAVRVGPLSRASISNSTIEGFRAVLCFDSTHIDISDTSLTGTFDSFLALDYCEINMTRGTLDGSVAVRESSTVLLNGVEQTSLGSTGPPLNRVSHNSYVSTNCARLDPSGTGPFDCANLAEGIPTTLLDIDFNTSSSAVMSNTTLDSLSCSQLADVSCDDTAIPSSSTCGSCPLPSATVGVDCSTGESINTALATSAEELTVEISGICTEEVIVDRGKVTLRGVNLDGDGNPLDGIQGTGIDLSEPPSFGNVLLIQEAELVTVENLRVTNGTRNGISINGFGVAEGVLLNNVHSENNAFWGLRIFRGRAFVNDSVFSGSGFGGANLGPYSHLTCSHCTLLDNPNPGEGTALNVGTYSTANLRPTSLGDSLLDGRNGVNCGTESRVDGRDSSIGGMRWALNSNNGCDVSMRRVTLNGSARANNGSTLSLNGVTQIALSPENSINQISNASFLRTNCDPVPGGSTCETPTSLMGISFGTFSNGILFGNSSIGDLQSDTVSDALCDGTESKNIPSSCSACP